MYAKLEACYNTYIAIFWSNLSRLNGLFIILNISMFFLSGLVSRGYYFTFYSIGCFFIVALLSIIPLSLMGRFWFYMFNLLLELIGGYFFLASMVYWIRAGAQLG